MPQTSDEEIKVRLMKQAEELIDKLLAEKKPKDEILLSDIEQAAIETGEGLKQAITAELVGERFQHEGDKPRCPQCGEVMRFKDYRKRWIETKAGSVEVERAYFYCKACPVGLFPPG